MHAPSIPTSVPFLAPRDRRRLALLTDVGVRLGVLVHRGTLDRALAHGADAANTRMLALRAGQLAGTRCRTTLADALEDALAATDRSARRRASAAIDPDRTAVRSNRTALLDLVDRLRAPEPVAAGGVARLLMLLRDGGGPLFAPGVPGQLTRALDDVDHALSG
jgi:hypothetical protein